MAVVLSAPVAVLPLVFSRYTVKLEVNGLAQVKTLLIRGIRAMVFVSIAILLMGLAAIPWVQQYLHLESAIPVLIMLVQLTLSLLFPVLLGVIQGLHRFVSLGLSASSVSLVRVLSGLVLLLLMEWGVNGALASGVMGVLIAIGIATISLRDILKVQGKDVPHDLYSEMRKYSLPVFISTTMVMTLGNLDIVLVKHYCLPEEAGLYSIAAILGRIALFLPGVLIAVLFPAAAKIEAAGKEDSRILWMSLGMTAFLGGGFALVCAFWPEQIIVLLFGEKYQAAAELLKTISMAMAMLAVANVIFTYCLARSEFKFLWPLVSGVIMMLVLISIYHDSALTIARMVLLSVGTILTGTLGWYFLRSARPVTSP